MGANKHSKVSAFVMSREWAITPEMLDTITVLANGLENNLGGIAEAAEKREERFNALSSLPPSRAEGATILRQDGNVAVLPVTGVISRYSGMFSNISGGTSVQELSDNLKVALADPSVDSIVFSVDSPGGDANGINELANEIYQARSKKRLTVYAGGSCASGAYWLAAAAGKVVVDAMADVGSIGVIMQIPKDDGSVIQIVSSQSPRKAPNPEDTAGKDVYQKRADAKCQVFVESVARFRGVTVEKVLQDYGQGECLVGAQAVEAGMAEAVGSLDDVIGSMIALPMSDTYRPMAAQQTGPARSESMERTETAAEATTSTQPEQIQVMAELEELRRFKAQALEQEQARLQESYAAEAKSHADELLKAGAILPADAETAASAFLAVREVSLMVGGETVKAADYFKSLVSKRPAVNLTQETMPENTVVLVNRTLTTKVAEEGASGAVNESLVGEMVNLATGKAALNGHA